MDLIFLTIVLAAVILLALPLLAPFHLDMNIRKDGPLLEGGFSLSCLGLTLKRADFSYQTTWELLASMSNREPEKKDAGNREGQPGIGIGREKDEMMAMAGDEKEKKPSGEPAEKKGAMSSVRVSSLINAAPPLGGVLFRLLRSILIKKISGRVCFGLDDPADTAVLSGYLSMAAAALGRLPSRVSFHPWFEGERLEGEMAVQVEARPLWAALAVIRAVRKKEIRLLLKEMAGWK
jgi:hypothetical protein